MQVRQGHLIKITTMETIKVYQLGTVICCTSPIFSPAQPGVRHIQVLGSKKKPQVSRQKGEGDFIKLRLEAKASLRQPRGPAWVSNQGFWPRVLRLSAPSPKSLVKSRQPRGYWPRDSLYLGMYFFFSITLFQTSYFLPAGPRLVSKAGLQSCFLKYQDEKF